MITTSTVFPEGLICQKSLRTVQIRNLVKLASNQKDWKVVIEERSSQQQGFRQLFIEMLEGYSGNYISHESLLKSKIREDPNFESEFKADQTDLKSSNLLYSRNFSVLVEALKLVFEVTLVDKHSSKLVSIFGLSDIHELRFGLAVNFVTYFVNRNLSSVLRQPTVALFVAAIVAEQASEVEAKEFVEAVSWFDNYSATFADHCGEKVGPTFDHKQCLDFNEQPSNCIGVEREEPVVNKFGFQHKLNFKESGSKDTLQSYLKHCSELWQKSMNELEGKKTPAKMQSSSRPGSPGRVANGSNSEITVNFQVLKDLDSKAGRLAKTMSNLFIGSEILRVELFRSLLEYNLNRKELKREKRDVIAAGLAELARESSSLLLGELENGENTSMNDELDSRECILCNGKDKHPIGGRLIHFKKQDWIHYNCALWSESVTEVLFGGLEVYQAVKKAKATLCPECGNLGGSVAGPTDSSKRFHLPCAVKNRCVFTVISSERKVYNPDVWIKNNLTVYQKHYKHSNPLYFLFCTSLEMITSFKATKRLYVVKRQLKGLLPDTVKSDSVSDLNSSLAELQIRKKSEAGSESQSLKPTISRIGGLIIVSMLEKTTLPDFHKTAHLISKLRHQFMLSLRRDMLSTTELYTEGKRDVYSLMLHKWIVARQVSRASSDNSDTPSIDFEVFILESDLERAQGIFTLRSRIVSGPLMERILTSFYNQEDKNIQLPADGWEIVDPKEQIETLFSKMGLCYGEVRSYLLSTLKGSLEKLRQSQHNFKNYADFQQVFYQSGLEQHILLDIEEKHSIYDRLKLIWHVNTELEGSRDFQRDARYIQEKQYLGCRSRMNPKSRSFNNGSAFQLNSNDNYRHAEKLILQLTNQRPNHQGLEPSQSASGAMKRKVNPLQKPSEKSSSLLKKGYLTYKTLNTMVAPSKIHKYGRLCSNRPLRRQIFSEGRVRD